MPFIFKPAIIILILISPILPSPIRIHPIHAGMSFAFAIESDNGCYLIDAGSPGEEKNILRQISRFSTKPLTMIILTHAHFDHAGSANRLRELTNARIAIHKNDAADLTSGTTRIDKFRSWGIFVQPLLPLVKHIYRTLPTTPDIILNDGDNLDSFGLPARVILTGGHSPGSITLVLPDNTAIMGDLIVSHPWPQPQGYFASDWEAQNASLARMQAINPVRIFSGHSQKPVEREVFLKFKPVR